MRAVRPVLVACLLLLAPVELAAPQAVAQSRIGELRDRAREHPSDASAWLALAQAYLQARQLDAAMAAYNRALPLRPTWDEDYAAFAQNLLTGGHIREATTVYEAGAARAPENAKVHAGLAEAYRYQGQWDKVIASYEKALSLNATDEEKSWWLESLAQAQTYANDRQKARKSYSEAAALRPDDFHTHETLGQSYMDLGDFANAEREFRRALELVDDPSNTTRLKELLASALLAQGKTQEAAKLSVTARNERIDEAKRDKNPQHAAGQAYQEAARLQREEGDMQFALQARESAIAAEPDEPWHYVEYAQDLERAGRAADAKNAYEQSIPLFQAKMEAEPARRQYYRRGLALALRKTGKTEETIPLMREETAMKPENASGWIQLGDALAAEERYDEAAQAYSRVESLAASDKTITNQTRLRAAVARGNALLGTKRGQRQAQDAWALGWRIYHAMSEEEQALAARERVELERRMPEPD